MKGKLLRLLKTCLSNRTFKVRIGSNLSDLLVQENGIPQGSVLSETLLLIVINGIAAHDIEKMLFVNHLSTIVRRTNHQSVKLLFFFWIENYRGLTNKLLLFFFIIMKLFV